ncbi:unnamed protein product [Musa hybrid cultivar]
MIAHEASWNLIAPDYELYFRKLHCGQRSSHGIDGVRGSEAPRGRQPQRRLRQPHRARPRPRPRPHRAQHVLVVAAQEVGPIVVVEGPLRPPQDHPHQPAGDLPRHQALHPLPRRPPRHRRQLPPFWTRLVVCFESACPHPSCRACQLPHRANRILHRSYWYVCAHEISFDSKQFKQCAINSCCAAVGGLLNATCGNATELIIALFALHRGKIEVVKCSLVGSILSNLLLVLGSSLFLGGIANLHKEQSFDRKQADVNTGLLLLGALCHILLLAFDHAVSSGEQAADAAPRLWLSRACSIVMLLAYVAYLFFQLKTHRQLYESEEEEDDDNDDAVAQDEAVIGFPSALAWLLGMTAVIAILSEYVVATIEAASDSWGISVSFISIILLPIVGNAAEHAGAIIFAFKNKLDITLGVSLGSATQISMFVVPLSVIVAWTMGIKMDLDLELLETGSLIMAILITAFTLQDGTSHYLKGLVPLLCYLAIGACFFVSKSPAITTNGYGRLILSSFPTH